MVDPTTTVSFVLLRQETVESLIKAVSVMNQNNYPSDLMDELSKAATDAQTVLESENQPVFETEITATVGDVDE